MTQDIPPPPNRELRREANVLEIIPCDPFCPETSPTWWSPSCLPFWPPESCQFVRTAFCLRGFVGFDLCESSCQGFASPGIVKLVGELRIREEAALGAVSAQFGVSSNRMSQKELWQPRRSLWVKGCEAGVWEELRDVGKGLVWMDPITDWDSWMGRDLTDATEQPGFVGSVPAQDRGLELDVLQSPFQPKPSCESMILCFGNSMEWGVHCGGQLEVLGNVGVKWGWSPQIKDRVVFVEVERSRISTLPLRVAGNSSWSHQ